ncbi:MAG: hypothetical protein JF922_02080 [Candidatus Dormibacteraeota bacterium]|uniref:Antitoxin n=2 Tax=Candidatus Nephthysia bennettiae TaxID=3127016 RepID=A0A934K521_9BACT|nr:hypothetical protein [Candidatus Dormibacteraeota bacterium]MBJ7614868.1 hypothetical protein [Candidatus Dormibacteraeota bacterium]
MRIGVGELKDGLSRVLRAVQVGETIEVIDHGLPIVRIIKVWPSPAQKMLAERRMIPSEIEDDLLELWPPPPLEPGERPGSEILTGLRAGER